MLTLLLCERGCLPQPLLYLSAFLARQEKTYKDHLLSVSQRGTWIEWINFFTDGVTEQARDAVQRARYLVDLWKACRERMQSLSQSPNVLRLVDALFSCPVITIPWATRTLGVTFPTAQTCVEKLQQEGVLEEVTGKQRHRVYAAPEILAILDEQAPPLVPPA
jgi:Fic family protein